MTGHRKDDSSFQIGVSRGLRIASKGRLARVLHLLHSIFNQPYPPFRHWAMVGDGCAIAFHADGPRFRVRNDHQTRLRNLAARFEFIGNDVSYAFRALKTR